MKNISIARGMSRDQLFRLIINRIWVRLDASGISNGRSLRAGLLESIFELRPRLERVDGLDLEDFISVAAAKSESRWDGQLLLDLGIEGLPSSYLILFIIKAIQCWYEWDEHLRQFIDSGVSYTPKQLIAEVKERGNTNHLFEMASPVLS